MFAIKTITSCLLAVLLMGLANQGYAGATSENASAPGALLGSRIPFTFDPLLQPRIIVNVSINGQPPLPFSIDTGLDAAVLIDTQAAEKLNLSPDLHSPGISVGAINMHKTGLNSLAFAGAAPAEVIPINGVKTALVGDMAALRPGWGRESRVGIIGIHALSGSAVEFDFVSHVMTFYPSPHPAIHIQGASSLPLQQHHGDGRYFVQATLQKEISTELVLDTGSEVTGIPMSVAQHLYPVASKSSGTGSAYGLYITPTLLLSSLSLGDCELDRIPVDSLPPTPVGFPLGVDLLSRCRVTMDFPNRLLLLEHPADDAQDVHLEGYTGIHLTARGTNFVVEDVDAESPAQTAGVHPGEVVKDIDEQMLDHLSFLTARRLLNGFAGTHAELTMQRKNGQDYRTSFVRIGEFDRPRLPIDGLFLSIPAHKPMEVVGLLHGCMGEKAGLQQGDTILEFNGHLTLGITPEILAVEIRKPQLTLRVQRTSVNEPLFFTLAAKQHTQHARR
jgi:hypothetical protein